MMQRTERLWKRRRIWPAPFDGHLERRLIRCFFDDGHHELSLVRTFVQVDTESGNADEIRLLIQYTDEDDGTGVICWFVYRRSPDGWRLVERPEV